MVVVIDSRKVECCWGIFGSDGFTLLNNREIVVATD